MYQIRQISERAVSIIYPEEISPAVHQKVMSAALQFQGRFPGILTDTVPSYHQVTLFFRRKVSFEKDRVWIEDVLKQMQSLKASIKEKVVTIPVLYGGDGGPDLGHVAKINGRSEQEVIDLHTAGSYTVYMLGFLPGFPYLGGLDEKLATPRKDSPRAHVPSGSVGIAVAQTGVYPLASPGGWQLIGRTPLELVNVNHRNPCLLKPGDQLRFVSISPAEFENYLKEGSVHADD